jgi:membrane-associated HD superfamily phosphohydrolase
MSESPDQPAKQSPQELLASLQREAVRQNQLLVKLTETIATQAHDIKRMRRVIVMIGWLIIIAGAIGIAVLVLNALYFY